MSDPIDHFPKELVREKQAKALHFIARAVEKGYKHITLSAPTGIGKSAIGVAMCSWAKQASLPGTLGGYYLVTQKLLQDQLENDFTTDPYKVVSLKSATEYECPITKNCGLGAMRKTKPCPLRKDESCYYLIQRANFITSHISITNYPYFLTERIFAKKLPKRKILIADECHTIERQIIRFIDITVSEDTLETWTQTLRKVPQLKTVNDFVLWVETVYLVEIKEKIDTLLMLSESDSTQAKLAFDLDQHHSRIIAGIKNLKEDPDNWVYWQDKDRNDKLVSIARPLSAAPFTHTLFDAADTKIYMSAYPGEKEVYCRSLNINPDEMAWCSLGSTFKPDNRPIVMGLIGSMSMRNVDTTLPHALKVIDRIITKHSNEKGIIHCNSYKLGTAIYNHFKETPHSKRLIFPENGDQREEKFKEHAKSNFPTIIISPSMAEGFDFTDNLARWQIIAKVPYPSLGDKQVMAKKNLDSDWYAIETIKTIVQACGRICRSDEDWGNTYILDSDFMNLWDRHKKFFPTWLTKAFVWPRS